MNQHCYSNCSKCPPSAFTQARKRFLKFAVDLQIASCGNSSQIFTSADFSSGMSFSCRFRWQKLCSIDHPNMIVKRIHVRAIWRPGVFVNKVWTMSYMRHFCSMRRHSILLENKLLAKQDLFTKQNDVIVTSLLSWYSVSWHSVVFSICKQDFNKNTLRRVHLEITSFENKFVPFLHAVMKL